MLAFKPVTACSNKPAVVSRRAGYA